MGDPYRSAHGGESGGPTAFCPACGSRTPPAALICGACGSELATVRCGACFHRNRPDLVLCQGCGAPLGLEPVGTSEALSCTRCHVPFQAFSGAAGKLHDCGVCGGQFVDHGLLNELLASREAYGERLPRRLERQNPFDQPLTYVACPVCKSLMLRKNFGGQSGIIVDSCAAHGTWFDRGELPRVLAFVEQGGLALARRQAAENEAQEKIKRAISDVKSPHFFTDGPIYDPAERISTVLGMIGPALALARDGVAAILRTRHDKP